MANKREHLPGAAQVKGTMIQALCLSAVGYYQGALETMKAPGPIRVRETECTCAGDQACAFDLTW